MDAKTNELIKKLDEINKKPIKYFSLDAEKQEVVIDLFKAFSVEKSDPTLLVKNLKDKQDLADFVYIIAEKCSETVEEKQLFVKLLDSISQVYKRSLPEVITIHPLNMIIEKQSKEAIEKVLAEKMIISRDPNARNPFITALYRGDKDIVELVTSRMETNEQTSSHHFYTYNYGNQFETILAFRDLAKREV